MARANKATNSEQKSGSGEQAPFDERESNTAQQAQDMSKARKARQQRSDQPMNAEADLFDAGGPSVQRQPKEWDKD